LGDGHAGIAQQLKEKWILKLGAMSKAKHCGNKAGVPQQARPQQNIVGTKRVFRNKQDEYGVVTRNKARLVVNGYAQVTDLDFEETSAPIARLGSIRVLLAYIVHRSFKLYQMDVKNVFLNGPIKEEIYMEQPLGFEDDMYPNHVYKLSKVLYGLKQALRACMNALEISLFLMLSRSGKLILLFSLRHMMVICLYAKYMSMT
jgi:hypothetical protein